MANPSGPAERLAENGLKRCTQAGEFHSEILYLLRKGLVCQLEGALQPGHYAHSDAPRDDRASG